LEIVIIGPILYYFDYYLIILLNHIQIKIDFKILKLFGKLTDILINHYFLYIQQKVIFKLLAKIHLFFILFNHIQITLKSNIILFYTIYFIFIKISEIFFKIFYYLIKYNNF